MDAFISSVLERLLATSVQTAVLAAVIWMLCRFVPRLSPSTQCWLWWLVALQAILGLVVSPIELPWLPHQPEILVQEIPVLQWSPLVPDTAAPAPAPANLEWFTWQSTVFLLWIAGSLLMAWSTVREWQRGRTLRAGSTPCNDEHLLHALTQAAASSPARKLPALRLSHDVDSPVLLGHARPMLLLPADLAMTDEELDMTFAHELAHLRRGDLWLGFVPVLARQLLFFHPLAHLAVREYSIAREAACDAGVMISGDRSRQDYGRLLVRLGTSPESRTGLAVNSPTFHSLQRRLSMLQKTSFLSGTVSIVLLGIVAATGVLPLRLVAATAPDVATPIGNAGALADPQESYRQYMFATTRLRELSQLRDEAERTVYEVFGPIPYATNPPPEVMARRKAATDRLEQLNDKLKAHREIFQRSMANWHTALETAQQTMTDAERHEFEKTHPYQPRSVNSPRATETRNFLKEQSTGHGLSATGTAATSFAGAPAPGNQRFPANEAQEFLNKQIAQTENSLRDEEARIAEFKARNPGTASAGGGGDYSERLTTAMASKTRAENALVLARARLSELQHKADAVKVGVQKTVESGATDLATPDVSKRRLEAEARLGDLRVRFKDGWPEVIAQLKLVDDLKNQEERELADLRRNNGASATRQLNSNPDWISIQREISKAQLEIVTLQSVVQERTKEIHELTQVINHGPELEQEYKQLVRSYEIHKKQYEELVVKNAKVQEINLSSRDTVKVVGQVRRPISLPYYAGLDVLSALNAAGGLTESAAPNYSTILHGVAGEHVTQAVKLGDLLNKGDIRQNIALQAGDTLVVP